MKENKIKVTYNIDLNVPQHTYFWILRDIKKGTYSVGTGMKVVEYYKTGKTHTVVKKVKIPSYLQSRFNCICIYPEADSYEEIVLAMENTLFVIQQKTESMVRNNIAAKQLVETLKKDGFKKKGEPI